MNLRFLLFFCLVFLTAFSAFGQQITQYSAYMYNPAQFNPAFAGLDGALSFTGVFRKQWVNLNGSPSQQILTSHLPLYFLNSGLGLNIENDILGARRMTSASLQYSYQLQIGKTGIFSIGLAGGLNRFNWEGSKLRTPDGNYSDNMLDHQDVVLPETAVSASAPSVDLGIFYQNENLGIGVSSKNFYAFPFKIGEREFSLKRHFLFFGQYQLDLKNKFSLRPSLLVKSDLVEFQTDFSLIVDYNGNIFGGATVRGFNKNSLEAAGILGGWRLSDQTTLVYVYDFPISDLAQVEQGSHEILLKYTINKPIGKGKLPKIIFNPRFL